MEKEVIRAIGYLNLILSDETLWEEDAAVLQNSVVILQNIVRRNNGARY